MWRDTILAFAAILLILGALAAKSLLLSVPTVRHAPGQFDADRAKARLAFILGDQSPHPADSDADDAVRGRLVAALQQMGVKPVVRDQFACNDFARARLVACARVRNVIAIIGPLNGKALLLSAHYDSVPVGPGASDDGIGVGTLLEVGSLLKNRPLKRPIILLFNEGEELGLVGARAFLADPLSRNVDSLLNFEARGVNGPVTMFETNDPNGAAIGAYAGSVKRPFASSLSTDLAGLIPNDTDVTVYKERGWITLNSAIVGNETRYHSPGDNLEGLDTRSLQDMGNEALALATRLSAASPRASGNRIFFDLAQRIFIQMPVAVGAIGLLLLLLAFAALSWRRGSLARGTATVAAMLVGGGLSAWLAVVVMAALRAGTYWRADPEITFLAIYATIILAQIAILRTIGASVETPKLRVIYWLVFLLLGIALGLIAPGGIIYFLFPPAVAVSGIIISRWYPRAEWIGSVSAVALLFVTWGELLAALEQLFSPGPLWIVVPVAAIVIAPALIETQSFVGRSNRRILLLGSAVVALVGWVVAGTAPAYSQDHQQRFTIEHVTEFPSRNSFWSVLNDGRPLPPSMERMARWQRGKLDFSERMRALAPAPSLPGKQPASIDVLQVVSNGAERTVRLRLRANGAERILLVAPSEAHIRAAGATRSVRAIADEGSSGKYTISCTGRSCDRAEMTIVLDQPKPVSISVVGSRNGLPPSAAPLVRARPPFARPQYVPDETLTVTRVTL